MTTIQRAVRRGNIPVKMSEGFNPRPRISFPTALSLGVESNDEVIYMALYEWITPNEIIRRFQEQLPSGIEITNVEPILSNVLPRVEEVEYHIIFNSQEDIPDESQIARFMGQEKVFIQRTRKEKVQLKDVKKFITKISKLNDKTMFLGVKFTTEGSVSPEEVFESFGVTLSSAHVRKIKTILNGAGA
jgi:radical SAM-linked protein